MAQGVTYDIDLAEPVRPPHQEPALPRRAARRCPPSSPGAEQLPRRGQRRLRRCFRDLPVVWRSYEEIRDLLVDYYSAPGHPFPTTPDHNWRIVPEAAVAELTSEIDADARRNAGKWVLPWRRCRRPTEITRRSFGAASPCSGLGPPGLPTGMRNAGAPTGSTDADIGQWLVTRAPSRYGWCAWPRINGRRRGATS